MRLFRELHGAFHDPQHPAYRPIEGFIWLLIVASIALFAVDVGVQATEDAPTSPAWLAFVDRILLGIFAVEVTLRILTYKPPQVDFYQHSWGSWLRAHLVGRLTFALSPLQLIDIVTVLAVVPALRGLRALRLLRLLHHRRLLRYGTPFMSVAQAFRDNALLYGLAFSFLGTVTVLGGISLFLVEGQGNTNPNLNTLGDGIWWALVTLTTVGFGDISPRTYVGRMIGAVLMICGMFTLALFAGIVGNTLLTAVFTIRTEQFRMSTYVDHVVICGFDLRALKLLHAIRQELDLDRTPVVIFADEERHPAVPPQYMWIRGDPTKESELDKVRMAQAASVLIVASRTVDPQHADATTILTAFTIRSYMSKSDVTPRRSRPLYIVAEILDDENVGHAHTAGADEIVETTRMGFSMMAHALAEHGTASIMTQVVSLGHHNLYVGDVPEDAPPTFGELSKQLHDELGVLVIGLRHEDGEQINPPDDTPIAGCTIVYLAPQAVLSSAS